MAFGQQKKSNPMDGYITVAERIELFYKDHPKGKIITKIIEHDSERGFVLIRAKVYRDKEDATPSATGHAYEIRDSSFVNKTSYIENAETSAAGRAIALLGYEIKRGIASREEMQKVERMQQTYPQPVKTVPPPESQPIETAAPAEAQTIHTEIKLLIQQLAAFGHSTFIAGADRQSRIIKHIQAVAKDHNWECEPLAIRSADELTQGELEDYKQVLTDELAAYKKTVAGDELI